MDWFTGALAYGLIWWMVLFTVLPWGVRTAEEIGQKTAPGHATSAPVRPRIILKFAVTTAIAAALFAILWIVVELELLDFRALVK